MESTEKGRGPSFFELARQALSSTRRGYDLLAPKFEFTPYATPLDWIESGLTWVEQQYPIQPGARGADLFCGTGRGARALRSYCTQVDGFDFSEGMLAEAARLSDSLSGLSWCQADLATSHLEVGAYDRIVTFGAWGHILPDFRSRLLAQTVHALKPGGLFITFTADEAKFWEKRYWFSLIFDLAIRIRNLFWPSEFHMYYRINSTQQLMESWTKLARNPGFPEFEIQLAQIEDCPSALKLFILRRKPSD